ncbi:hypothetical protein ACWDWU_09280 [Streptomyces sp. NPDC003442]
MRFMPYGRAARGGQERRAEHDADEAEDDAEATIRPEFRPAHNEYYARWQETVRRIVQRAGAGAPACGCAAVGRMMETTAAAAPGT